MSSTTSTVSQPKEDRGLRADRDSPHCAEALDRSTIAGISSLDIARMSRPELVRVVLAAHLPHLRPAVRAGLDGRDRQTLERLAHQARLCCRY